MASTLTGPANLGFRPLIAFSCVIAPENAIKAGESRERGSLRGRRGQASGYQIRIYPDSGINCHGGIGVMAKDFPFGEDFSPSGRGQIYRIMKIGPEDTLGVFREAGRRLFVLARPGFGGARGRREREREFRPVGSGPHRDGAVIGMRDASDDR